MKKLALTIIILAIIAGLGVYGFKKFKNQNTTTTNISTSKQETKSNVTNSPNKENLNNSSNTINQTKTDWNTINSECVLSSENTDYMINKLKETNTQSNIFDKKIGSESQSDMDQMASNDAKLITNLVNNIFIPMIQSKLSGNTLDNFNQSIATFNTYNTNSVLSIYNSKGGFYSMLPMQQANLASSFEYNMANYLIGAYSKTGNNPTLGSSFNTAYLLNGNTKTYDKFSSSLQNAISSSASLSNNMDKDNPQDVLKAYKQIYTIWNNEINTVYPYIKKNSGGSINGTNLTASELVWINFKDAQVNIAGQNLTGITKEIVQEKMRIRFTQLRTYNLLNSLSGFVGIHY